MEMFALLESWLTGRAIQRRPPSRGHCACNGRPERWQTSRRPCHLPGSCYEESCACIEKPLDYLRIRGREHGTNDGPDAFAIAFFYIELNIQHMLPWCCNARRFCDAGAAGSALLPDGKPGCVSDGAWVPNGFRPARNSEPTRIFHGLPFVP
eukprot:1764836-Pyramimonas_sp.AAC.1